MSVSRTYLRDILVIELGYMDDERFTRAETHADHTGLEEYIHLYARLCEANGCSVSRDFFLT
jgi:hypothetical protein